MTSEHLEQVAYFEWVDIMAKTDERYLMIFAVPNGGHRHKAVGAKLKREGVRRGIMDIFVDVPVGKFHGLRIELKLDKTKRLTNEQREWIKRLRYYGYAAERCNGFYEAQAMTERYFANDCIPF